ncbi:MAG: hypothetical protein ACRD1W_13635 [Vicinamibacterales bacterium]
MHRIAALLVVLTLVAGTASAQNEQTTSSATTQTTAVTTQSKGEGARFATRSNVRIELTISDQRADGANEKKQVSMIVSETSWGKIRTHATTRPPSPTAGPNMDVDVALNVDARPFINAAGNIQLELVVNYNPLDETNKAGVVRPTELNQSLTVILQSGKPLVVAQAADPMVDRKMIVEVVATILK